MRECSKAKLLSLCLLRSLRGCGSGARKAFANKIWQFWRQAEFRMGQDDMNDIGRMTWLNYLWQHNSLWPHIRQVGDRLEQPRNEELYRFYGKVTTLTCNVVWPGKRASGQIGNNLIWTRTYMNKHKYKKIKR